ncbi:hypothetical protein QUF72_00055, partial [Desulfobacterales bacterium HSG2]|nr:hypothetical protein [Desulfobacterales bacterium HSG2]
TLPVIPGKSEKMGHFFTFDPESTAAMTDSDLKFCLSDRNDMTGRGRSIISGSEILGMTPVVSPD